MLQACLMCGTKVESRSARFRFCKPCRKIRDNDLRRERYHSDPAYRERRIATNSRWKRNKKDSDPEYKSAIHRRAYESRKRRMAADPAYRIRQQAIIRKGRDKEKDRYHSDSNYRNERLARYQRKRLDRYRSDPDYRRRTLDATAMRGKGYRKHWRALFDAQEGLCGICSDVMDLNNFRTLHVDHKQPLSRGGTDDIENLQLTHARCNLTKGNRIA